MPGFGAKTVEIIKEGLETVQKSSFEKRDLLGVALPIARGIVAQCGPNVRRWISWK